MVEKERSIRDGRQILSYCSGNKIPDKVQVKELQSHLVSRNSDLDIVKGMLVIVMLVYHCASVTIDSNSFALAKDITLRVSFIHSAFIMISGFLCGWYYGPQMEIEEKKVRNRLFVRSIKLFGLLVTLNSVLYVLGLSFSPDMLKHTVSSPGDIMNHFVININGGLVAFEILFYIAAVLFIASLLLGRIQVVSTSVITLCLLLLSPFSTLVRFVAYGCIGMLAGILTAESRFDNVWELLKRYWWLSVPLLIVFQIYYHSIHATVQAVPGIRVITYTFETLLWFIVFVFLLRTPFLRYPRSIIIFLGRYTLFGYIAQMLIIRSMLAIRKAGIEGLSDYLTVFIISSIILYMFIFLTDHLRSRNKIFNETYRFAFE